MPKITGLFAVSIVATTAICLIVCPALCGITPDAPNYGLRVIAQPFFVEQYLIRHGEKKQKGDLRLDTLSVDLESPKVMGHWMEVLGRITSGEMPSEDKPRPRADDIARVSEWITNQLRDFDAVPRRSLALHRDLGRYRGAESGDGSAVEKTFA